ncbi:ATP-binding protein [Rhodanobacter glycinis]|uniref:Sensory/regulatory protein RpfC n=1 Tax=Rhodanobacter glycinis TaxID=582702 RepID=A0A1I4CQA6_9GAMM|nr:ATP-binding protein [Rhodanobacter glycinis]SFK82246.1 His Kinase A (phospho-acceptor) domain-containing protein [Rhodanobacter glycinis]
MTLTATIEILAALLSLSGVLALILLRAIWLQQRRLKQAEKRLRQLALDMEAHRENERRTRATEQSLREITWHVPVVVFVVRRGRDRRPRLSFLAGNLRALLGLNPQDMLESDDVLREWPFQDRIHPEDRERLRQHLRQAMRHAQATSFDFRACGPESLRWLHLAMVAHRQGTGETRWVGYLIDTTPIHTHNQTLRAARDAAERASRAKADFLATMSHEIRTPMNGVIGMLELLGRTSLDADQHELLHAVEDSASVLLQILDDVLDFSKLEAGNLRLDPVPFDPRTLVDNVVSLSAGPLHRKGLDVAVSMDSMLAGRLLGDDVRLRQILLNLLNNAGKFTEQGRISVTMRVLGDDDQHQRFRLSVTDTGIGIPPDKQIGLFTPFTQAEAWTARRHGGTGLGLAICRHLVQLMGGRIELTSDVGVGTTVTVELRLPIVQREVDGPAGLRGRHAVVRLASAELTHALDGYLAALGLSVEVMPPSHPLRPGVAADFLFVDAHDHDSAKLIAARVIAVDATPQALASPDADRERILLGAHPLKWQAVVRACTLALQPQESIAPRVARDNFSAPATPARSPRSGRILVAEDHPVNQSLVRRQLDLLGWSCDVVDDGQAAYEALCRTGYALLLTDCQMPVMDGCALAMAWREHETREGHTQHLPIIAMTAHMLGNDVARFHQAGMDDCLGKPVQLHALEEKLLAWTARAAPLDARATTGEPPALHGDMLRLLLETSRDDLSAIEQALAQGNASIAAQRLHRLLGGLQIFTGEAALAQALQRVDELHGDRAGEALRQLPADLADLRKLLDRLEHPVSNGAD